MAGALVPPHPLAVAASDPSIQRATRRDRRPIALS
jgi:hypothetical protein